MFKWEYVTLGASVHSAVISTLEKVWAGQYDFDELLELQGETVIVFDPALEDAHPLPFRVPHEYFEQPLNVYWAFKMPPNAVKANRLRMTTAIY